MMSHLAATWLIDNPLGPDSRASEPNQTTQPPYQLSMSHIWGTARFQSVHCAASIGETTQRDDSVTIQQKTWKQSAIRGMHH